jgi:D-glycero-D-manno-heptose 1,7-bisphosphate phosphatase
MNRAVFLDRDGVLNEAVMRNGRPYPPGSLAELNLIPDTTLLGRLKDAGFLLIVITNQPDVARHTQDRGTVEAINAAIGAALPIDEFFVCWHDDADSCDCRKPKPGLFFEAAARREIDLGRSFMVGDRWRDIDAGAAAGCLTVLIDRNYAEKLSQNPDFRTGSLAAAIDWILGGQSRR